MKNVLSMTVNLHSQADELNRINVESAEGRLLPAYWVVRDNTLCEIPRLKLTLPERNHISELSYKLKMIIDEKLKALRATCSREK
jgi:hypothetical protein